MRVLDYLLRRLLNVVVTVPWLSLGIIVGVVHKEAGVSILFSWVRFFFRLFDVEVTSEDENDPGQPLNGCIFTLLDQTSLLDGPIGVTAIPRPCRGIVNLEYALIPFFGWSQWVFCWVIVRQWPAQAKRALSKARAFLKEGGNLWVSIEGRRSRDGSMSRFKKGPVVLAIEAQARIVPVVIEGAKQRIGYGDWRIRPGRVVVRFLKAIPTTGMRYEGRDRLLEELTDVARQNT